MLPVTVKDTNQVARPQRYGFVTRALDRASAYGWNYVSLYYFIQSAYVLGIVDIDTRNQLFRDLAGASATVAGLTGYAAYEVQRVSRRAAYHAYTWLYNNLVPYDESGIAVIEDVGYIQLGEHNIRIDQLEPIGRSFINLPCRAEVIEFVQDKRH